MSQPPYVPPATAGDGAADGPSYRGSHSSPDDGSVPATDDLWGGPGTPGPWSGGADQPWAGSTTTDPWAGAKGAWTEPPGGPDDTGPAYPVPGAAPAPEPLPPEPLAPIGFPPVAAQPAPVQQVPAAPEPGPQLQPGPPVGVPTAWAAPQAPPEAGVPGYGPPSYGDPAGPAAGPPVGEPAYAPPQQQFAPPQPGEPFRTVRADAVPPAAGPAQQQPPFPPQPQPAPAETYIPAEAPPTPRPPQPELPDSMDGAPQYAARLAPAPLPEGAVPPPHGAEQGPPPGWGGPPPEFQPQFAPQGPPVGWPQGAAGGPVHAAGGTPPPPVMPRPEDLLVSSRPRTLEKPATWGWRGRFARMSGGLYKPKPSAAELADRQAKLNAQRGFSRPMTVVVIQPKGGAGKTPTTICVSSALGVRRGGYIVGWDNNETRGTLAVRTSNDDNQRTTAWDLLGRLDEFERSEARVGDLSYYMRAQGDAQFDALVSDDNPGNMAQIGEVEFKRIHSVLQRFYRMIIIDTGNNVRSTNWQAAVDHADQIVVVSTYQRDVGYSGSWVLDHLAQTGRDELARDAITVLTAAEPDPDSVVRGELMKHFGARTRAVVEVPYDPHIAEGGPIRWDELSESSKRAWTSVAAAITQTLYDRDQRQLAAAGRPGA